MDRSDNEKEKCRKQIGYPTHSPYTLKQEIITHVFENGYYTTQAIGQTLK